MRAEMSADVERGGGIAGIGSGEVLREVCQNWH